MIAAGADIIDIGAESTKPGAVELSVEEEQTRLIPVLQAIRAMNIEIPISVDTRNAKTAEIAIKNGADIINDVSFGDYDKNMLKTIVNLNVPYVLTHSQGTPQNMQINPKYNNVVDEVYFAIEQKVHKLCEIGLNPENLIIDVGIGFGKTVEHNYELIKHIDEFAKLNYPILVGHSKKSFLSKSLKISSESLALATSALSCYIWSKSVSIIRVHDIEQHKIVKNLINKLS